MPLLYRCKLLEIKTPLVLTQYCFTKISKKNLPNSLRLSMKVNKSLTPNEARNFSASFKNTDEIKATYLLDKGKYVFIDEAIRPALKAVKTASNFPREKRIDFAQSPQKYIKEILDEELGQLSDIDREIQSAQIDELFIETSQFSERVTEIGVWEAPDLPGLSGNLMNGDPIIIPFLCREN